MSFQHAVKNTPCVAKWYHPGLQALTVADRARIKCHNTRRLTGSIHLDAALQTREPNASRWDYGIGFRENGKEVAIWVEVHPADSAHIDKVLAKLAWLKEWLRSRAQALRKISPGLFYWISTDRVHLTYNSPQARRLAKNGLQGPLKVLQLRPRN